MLEEVPAFGGQKRDPNALRHTVILGQNNGDCDIPRSSKPHIAIVTMKIDIKARNPDDTLDFYSMGDKALKKYGISQKGQFVVKGSSEADCINKLKEILERIGNGKK